MTYILWWRQTPPPGQLHSTAGREQCSQIPGRRRVALTQPGHPQAAWPRGLCEQGLHGTYMHTALGLTLTVPSEKPAEQTAEGLAWKVRSGSITLHL